MFQVWFNILVVLGDRLPFQCPYQIPEDSPQPTVNLGGGGVGGLDPLLYNNGDLNNASSSLYAEYRAALALVPCNARALSVFTKEQLSTTYTISVIFVYEEPVNDLKRWLK